MAETYVSTLKKKHLERVGSQFSSLPSKAIREVLVGEEAKKMGLRFVTWTQIFVNST